MALGTEIAVVSRNVDGKPQQEIKINYAGQQLTQNYNLEEIALALEEAKTSPTLAQKLKETAIEFVKPRTILKTARALLPDIADIAETTLDIAAEYWERKATGLAEQALLDFAQKVPGRAWNISVPSPSPIQSIPAYTELVPATELETPIGNLDELQKDLQPPVARDLFDQIQELNFLVWFYSQLENRNREITEIALFISTSGEGEGLAPDDNAFVKDSKDPQKIKISKEILGQTVDNYNPNRVLIATGKKNAEGITWTILDGSYEVVKEFTVKGSDNVLPIGDYLNLTPGRYHYQLWSKQRNGQIIKENPSSFDWYPTVTPQNKGISAFPSVTVITPDAAKNDPESFKIAHNLGLDIASKVENPSTKNVLRYESTTGKWIPISADPSNTIPFDTTQLDTTKPLILIPDWQTDSKPLKYNSGTAEAVADSVFASLVNLDDELGGEVGNSTGIYDPQGNLIYTPGELFNSPFHFISFGSGAVVNTEIIQRIGTAFPKKDTQFKDTFPDLQMTTIDFYQEEDPNISEPRVEVWDNVTFADNYYQSASSPYSDELSNKESKADLNVALGGENEVQNRVGFTGDQSENEEINKDSHERAVIWYEGTVNINAHELGVLGEYPVHRRRGDFSQPEFSNSEYPWYVANDITGDFDKNEYEKKQWEGNGTGWFYSVLGNGYFKRPKADVNNRVSVSSDNTPESRMQGDFAVPTLFNGNFDSINFSEPSKTIPGWSLHNSLNGVQTSALSTQNALVDWNKIPSLSEERIIVGYQTNSRNQIIDPDGNPVENLNIKSLKDALIEKAGYRDDNDNFNNLVDRQGRRVTGLEFNLLLEDLTHPDVGYRIALDGTLLYKNEEVIGIDVKTIAESLSNHPNRNYAIDEDDNLVDENGNEFINPNKVKSLQRKLAAPLKESYLERLEIDSNAEPNYALKLEAGQEIIHNRFIVPDWGTLRFDLHVPDVEVFDPGLEINRLKIFMSTTESGTQEYELSSRVIVKETTKKGELGAGSRIGETRKGVEILFDDDYTNISYAANRIGFGSAGFETFHLDIPDQLRGKTVTLRFELEEDTPAVYLDNVFFQSQHLLFGNPTAARIKFDPYPTNLATEQQNDLNNDVNRSNYLIENPQYTLSYNDVTKNANWVSWQLNKSWLGAEVRRDTFEEDRTLPFHWKKVQGKGDISKNRDGFGEQYARGHLAPSGDRTRNQKDNYATFLMSNIIPQNQVNNSVWWVELEDFSRHLLEDGRELYIIAGGRGTKTNLVSPQGFNINVPERLWKVVIVLDKPGQTIADVDENTMAFAIDLPNIDPENDTVVNPTDWRDYVIPVKELENYLALQNYDFLSNIPTEIQKVIEERPKTKILQWINANYPTSPLLAKSEENNLINKPTLDRIGTNTAIRHDSFVEDSSFTVTGTKFFRPPQIGITEVDITEPGFANNSISKYGSTEIDIAKGTLTEMGIAKVNPFQTTSPKIAFKKTGITKFGEAHIALVESTRLEIGIAEVGFSVNTSSNNIVNPMGTSKATSSKIFFSPSISSDQFFSIHNPTPSSINTIDNSALNLWNTLVQPSTLFDINLEIKNLPTGQLAEAQVTKFDAAGRPIGGTIEIDDDANGVGWFIDPTPTENSEFNQPLSETAFRATNTSAAYGYDLLTTILHEMGHIAGIISGYNNYDRRIKTINGSPVFVGDDFIATLTPDLSHLDPNAHPYDLMNTHLAPGMRKLPSELNLKIINAIRSSEAGEQANTSTEANKPLTSPLTSAPLYGIVNGSFDLVDLENQPYGWSDLGSTNIEQGYAVLREDSPFLSNLSQTFFIPEGAKTLQFTLKDTQLGTSKNLPNDAVEVALLDPTTLTPLAGTSTGLSNTDSLLNLQANGTAYYSNYVNLAGANASGENLYLRTPRTVQIDISQLTPGTLATLHFDLIGFGAADSSVKIDNVKILGDVTPPVALPDSATTIQKQPIQIDILSNDNDLNGTLNPTEIEFGVFPKKGTVTINNDGTLNYTPNDGAAGEDIFTYRVQDNEGAVVHTYTNDGTYNVTLTVSDADGASTSQTLSITVNNTAPIIKNVTGDTNINEGDIASFSAIALDNGNDILTYTWDYGDGSNPVTGNEVSHLYTQNGTYNVTLTVTDPNGGVARQSLQQVWYRN